MFFAPVPFRNVASFPGGRERVERYLVVGTSETSSSAYQLVQMLQCSGEHVMFASALSTSAQVLLNFRSRRLWSNTMREVGAVTAPAFDVVIDPDGFGFANIDKPKWRNRKMEEWRRIYLAFKIIRRSRKCVLLLNLTSRSLTPIWFTLFLILVSVLVNRFSTQFAGAKTAATSLFRRTVGRRPAPEIELRRTENKILIQGITEGESGLARNAKMSIEAFSLARVPTEGFHGINAHCLGKRKLTAPVALHHANANRIPRLIDASNSSLNIGFLLWELETVPESHMLAGDLLDEIWVPSSHVQKTYQRAFGREVVNVGKGINLPNVEVLNLSSLGIGADKYVFLTCFDAHSSVERKNPLAAVRAFLLAFPDNPNVRLIVKTTPIDRSHWGDPNGQMATIHYLAEKDPRIIIDNRMLQFSSLLSMIKRADCIVSSHRAEGFGYIPAYALSFAKPVIVTDYSGTKDFCTSESSFPVGYSIIDAKPSEIIEPVENAFWADVEVSSMASAMLEVFEYPNHARARALVGQSLIKNKYSQTKQADRYLRRLIKLGAIEPN